MPLGLPMALSCLDFCKLNIHAAQPVSEAPALELAPGTYKMISSTALPNVTFINAPTVSPKSLAILWVAWLNKPAKGTIAIAFMANTTLGFILATCRAMPTGTNIKRTLSQLESKICLHI